MSDNHSNSSTAEGGTAELAGHHVSKVAHIDGTIDYIDAHAVGGQLQAMPHGYYRSLAFIGTFLVRLRSTATEFLS